MKKSRKIFAVLVAILLLTTTGCTKNLKDADNKVVVNEETGQNLPANIMCKPTDEDILKLYRKTKEDLTAKYDKQLEEKEITKKNYDKKMKSLVDVDELVPCDKFKVTSGGYEGIWNSLFIKPLTWIIIKIGMLVKNYGLAIIITTFAIRLLMYPITLKTAKQSEGMKKAGPELSKLEKKYANKNDQQSMMEKNQEMMAIYKKYGINPMSGCLFGFIQIPLFFAFYESLYRLPALFEDKFLAFELSTAPLKAMGKGHWIYIILPILVAVTTFFSFKLNSGASMNKDQEKQMKYMMIFMMFMIVFMSFSMSSAIILYWITNSTFTIIQNLLVKRRK
jgi:YidC/Oxa1 family membrane protein insertase